MDIREDEELVEGAKHMEGLGASILNKGILLGRQEGKREGILLGRQEGKREGILEGQLRMLTDFVREGLISIADAARRANMNEIDFTSAMESILNRDKPSK